MKIRTGFVSNSSSSSFIVAVPALPTTTIEERLQAFSTIVKEWEYDSVENLPYTKGFSYEICKQKAEEGYKFVFAREEFGTDTLTSLLEDIDGFVVCDFY